MVINMHEAKTNLSKLIALLEKGEEIIIAKANIPIAKLVKYKEPKRKPNTLKDKVTYYEDFDSSNNEITKLFEGN